MFWPWHVHGQRAPVRFTISTGFALQRLYAVRNSKRDAATGGQISTGQGIVFAGDPAQGEAYLHELTHAVLAPYIGGALLDEGVPTWFGGLRGRSTASLYQLVVEYQDANPKTTLAHIIYRTPQDDIRTDDVLRATGALFVEHVYRRAGIAGLRALKGMPNEPSAVLAAMGRHLPLSTDSSALERWWRDAARAAVRRR